jgi:chromosome segregation ATPase
LKSGSGFSSPDGSSSSLTTSFDHRRVSLPSKLDHDMLDASTTSSTYAAEDVTSPTYLLRLEEENKDLRQKCAHLESVVLSTQKQTNDDLITLLCEFRQAKDEIDQLTSDNIAKESELLRTQQELRHARDVQSTDEEQAASERQDERRNDKAIIAALEQRIATITEETATAQRKLEEELNAKYESIKADLKRATRKNQTMLLQIKFMESQVEMLQKEKLSAEQQSRAQDSLSGQPGGVHTSDIASLQHTVHKLQQDLLTERSQHATTKALYLKYKQAQASLLGMVDCYSGSVDSLIQARNSRVNASFHTNMTPINPFETPFFRNPFLLY